MYVLDVGSTPLEFQRIEVDEDDDCCSCPVFCDEFSKEDEEGDEG